MMGFGGGGARYVRNIQRAADAVSPRRRRQRVRGRKHGGKRWDIHLHRSVRRRDRLDDETRDSTVLLVILVSALFVLFLI